MSFPSRSRGVLLLVAFWLTPVLTPGQVRIFPKPVPIRPPTPINLGGGYCSYSGNVGNLGGYGAYKGGVGYTGGVNFGNFGGFNIGGTVLPAISPGTPTEHLVPAPMFPARSSPRSGVNLALVPEVGLTHPFPHDALGHAAALNLFAGALHLQGQEEDGFVQALLEHRPDLGGLPFLRGGACRPADGLMRHFVIMRKQVLAIAKNPTPGATSFAFGDSKVFWKGLDDRWAKLRAEVKRPRVDKPSGQFVGDEPVDEDDLHAAKVAVLMQMCGAETAHMQSGLVKAMAGVPTADASRALARIALFADNGVVRREARRALEGRSGDYAEVLRAGLRYPWPEVAERAAQAIVHLQRDDLIANLIDVLDTPDPRVPQDRFFWGKPLPVARELVRVNHHRNCLLCHAALWGPNGDLSAAMPLPDRPLTAASNIGSGGFGSGGFGYGFTAPGPHVAFNVTYLRQDFSLTQSVGADGPWPAQQRFDFFVRERLVSGAETESLRKVFGASGQMNPYHRAAWLALRELTGLNGDMRAATWRELVAR